MDLGIRTRLLASELVTRERQDGESIGGELIL